MRKIKLLNMFMKYNSGLFNNASLQTLAKAISILLDKVDEQANTINTLIDEVEKLKQK